MPYWTYRNVILLKLEYKLCSTVTNFHKVFELRQRSEDVLKPRRPKTNSPADRGTKKQVYLPYRGAIPFWFYLVPLRLVSIFLNIGHVKISCGLLPTRFSSILL